MSHKLAQKGIRILLRPYYLCYNTIYITGIRPPNCNLSVVSILHKNGKRKTT